MKKTEAVILTEVRRMIPSKKKIRKYKQKKWKCISLSFGSDWLLKQKFQVDSLLIFILHQYLALGRWPLLTSGIQRCKNLIHVMCRPARLFEGNSGHVPHWARTQWFASGAAHKWSLKGSGNVLPNGPEKSHTNLQPWPAVNVSAHFPEALPTLAFIIFKISCNLLSWQWKHLIVFSFEFL